jgi:phosphoserine phosphatase
METQIMSELNVTLAKAQLDQATRERAIELREATKIQLARTRDERINAENELEQMVSTIKQRDHAIQTAQSAIDVFVTRLTEHAQLRPEVADVLPHDPSVVAWQNKHNRLTEAHAQAVARRRELENQGPAKIEAVHLHEKVTKLQRSERNLVEQLNGTGPAGGWKSSLSRVL